MTPRETNAADPASAQVRSSIDVPPDLVVGLLGSADENLRALEGTLAADLHARGNAITLSGEPADVALAERVIAELVTIVASGQPLTPEAVRHSVAMLVGSGSESPAEVLTLDILSRRGKTIRPKTLNQKRYVDAIDANTIVFGIGPAGTGKTYLAMAKAVNALQSKQVTRIILTRPAVEAGERLGFLPGTLSEKIDPYLRPLYDALYDMMDPELIPKLMSAGVIEVAPLAYMRGRAQPLFTKVLTPNGFRPIGDLHEGDFVVGSDGRPTEVLGVYPQGFKEIYRIHAQDGSSTLASGDHLWSVYTREDRSRGKPPRVLQTKEMIGNLRAADEHRYELPLLSAPVRFTARPVPLDPYALGLLLGDGDSRPGDRHGLAGVRSSTEFVPRTTCSMPPMCGWPFCKACSIARAGGSAGRDAPAASSTRRPAIGCVTTWCSWSARSAASSASTPGLRRGESPASPAAHTIDPTRTSSIFVFRRALPRSGWPARPRSTTPRVADRCASSTVLSPQEPRKLCASRWRLPIRCMSPRISCSHTTLSTTRSSFSTRHRTPRPSR
ncbi:phoH-like family protein [Mycobacterium xenopi 4042]|uniref:PhoH-like protein n=1 Tax=Mycobacterium xenopi 4042 TaxID=1299334 RepID=X8AQH4_MYCXE|nr:phoH-like family protein [Mycobacterium xenopi 4042]